MKFDGVVFKVVDTVKLAVEGAGWWGWFEYNASSVLSKGVHEKLPSHIDFR